MNQQEQTTWTLPQLCSVAAAELDRRGAHQLGAFQPLQDSMRNVRYYVYLGMMDRPLGYNQDAPRFGKRHLVQLLAIRALQSQGASLATIQQQTRGANTLELAIIAEQVKAAMPQRRAGDRVTSGDRVHPALPKPNLALLVEDRETFMDWLHVGGAPALLNERSVSPRPSLN